MKKFSRFYFNKFEFDKTSLEAKFYYSFDNSVFFEEVIDFKSRDFVLIDNIDYEIFDNILFNIHIALGISYYKLFPTKKLIVESGYLEDYQIQFWKKFYRNGLGEFLFINKIKPNNLFDFINNSKKQYSKKEFEVSKKALVPIGGGKDSIVTIELLKRAGIDFDLFVFGKQDILKNNTGNVSGKKTLFVSRKISPVLFDLNTKGYYNGHVPITGLIAFIILGVAYLYNYKYLVLSNEKSANFGNTIWDGFIINHQYSKSIEFEKDFSEYVEKYISSDIKYFSLLRGFYEVKIAELFSRLGKKYFGLFSSCNNNFKILKIENKNNNYWCNECPKCLFVFSILSPHLDNQELLKIFGEDLFEKKELEKIFRELLGISGIKPFECVGEAEEVMYSMYKSINKYDEKNLPYILNIFKKEVLQKINPNLLEILEKKFVSIDDEDIIPREFKKLIFKNTKIRGKKIRY